MRRRFGGHRRKDVPSSLKEAADDVVVHVSDTESKAFWGTYNPLAREPEIVEEEVMGDEPTDHEVEIDDNSGGCHR